MRLWIQGLLLVVAFGSQALATDNWTNWRGPSLTGVAGKGAYPIEWGPDENVAWKVELPGLGGSTPAVWGDRIFVTVGVDGENFVVAYDRKGQELWRTPVGKERAGKHRKATGSNPSPVTDGESVFVYFKSGDFACLDPSGKLVWHINLQEKFGEDTLWWDLGTSPILTREHVVVACMHSGPSYLAAFDKKTGQSVWKQERNMEAPEEANQSYSTPVVTMHDGKEVIVVLGADHITGHDAKSGAQLWLVGGLNPTQNGYFRSISSPVISDDVVVAPYARGGSLTAVRLGGQGDVRDSHVVWESEAISSDVPTPASKDGRIYVLADKGRLACLDAQSGQVLSELTLPKHRDAYSASPMIAGNYLYLIREDGTAFVVELGEELKVVAENELGSLTVASPVFVDGQILIRTSEYLYCIGQ
jgi:outer membrane protein assembly factor BamB